MAGFLDFLSAAATPALQYRTGQLEGEQAKQDKETEGFLGALKLARQQQEDALNDSIKREQLRQMQQKPVAPPIIVPRGGKAVDPLTHATIATGEDIPTAPVTRNTTKGIEEYDPASKTWKLQRDEKGNPVMPFTAPPPPPTNVYLPSLNKETGETDYTVVPNRGPVTPQATNLIKPPTGAGGGGLGGGTPTQQANLEGGYATLQHADERATRFEEKLRKGVLGQEGGKSISGVETLLSPFTDPTKHPDLAGAAQIGMNALDPEMSAYLKDIAATANAGMMVAARPSDVRMKKEQFISGLTANPNDVDLINQVQQWRKDILSAYDKALQTLHAKQGGPPLGSGGRGGGAGKTWTDPKTGRAYKIGGGDE